MTKTVSVILILLTTITSVGCAQTKQTSPVAYALGCVASQNWALDNLHELGVSVGQKISIRQKTGLIPNVTPENPGQTTLLVLNHAGSKGWMFFFHKSEVGDVVIERNAYRVERTEEGWEASEGNGGIATYKAISAYAAILYRTPPMDVMLKPTSHACQVE